MRSSMRGQHHPVLGCGGSLCSGESGAAVENAMLHLPVLHKDGEPKIDRVLLCPICTCSLEQNTPNMPRLDIETPLQLPPQSTRLYRQMGRLSQTPRTAD
jgi:hypothetical protein